MRGTTQDHKLSSWIYQDPTDGSQTQVSSLSLRTISDMTSLKCTCFSLVGFRALLATALESPPPSTPEAGRGWVEGVWRVGCCSCWCTRRAVCGVCAVSLLGPSPINPPTQAERTPPTRFVLAAWLLVRAQYVAHSRKAQNGWEGCG